MTRSTARRRLTHVSPSPSGAEVAGGCLGVLVVALIDLALLAAAVWVVVKVASWAWGA